ncbi:unnamed protein product, partial [Iphiclides podalirius]
MATSPLKIETPASKSRHEGANQVVLEPATPPSVTLLHAPRGEWQVYVGLLGFLFSSAFGLVGSNGTPPVQLAHNPIPILAVCDKCNTFAASVENMTNLTHGDRVTLHSGITRTLYYVTDELSGRRFCPANKSTRHQANYPTAEGRPSPGRGRPLLGSPRVARIALTT